MTRVLAERRLTLLLSLFFSLVLTLVLAGAARADGGGGGGGGAGSDPDSCPNGQTYDYRTGGCVRRQAGAVPDADFARYAVALSRAKRYGEALAEFETMRNPADTVALLPDADLPEYAIVLAKAKRYPEALAVLDRMQHPGSAVALNYRGYITRHLGRVDEGIGYYLRSVALDPNYAQVREYLGEAYVIKGKLAEAKVQLAMIGKICGNTECDEYEDLENAIAGKGIED